jgi:hypothetical protein
MPVLFDPSTYKQPKGRKKGGLRNRKEWQWFTHLWHGWHKCCLDYMLQTCTEMQLYDHIVAVEKAKQSNRAPWVYESDVISFAKHVPTVDLIDAIVRSRSQKQ